MPPELQHLMPDSRERMTNFVHNASQILGITPAAISQIVHANPALVDQAIHYEGERLVPIDPPPAAPPANQPDQSNQSDQPETPTPSTDNLTL